MVSLAVLAGATSGVASAADVERRPGEVPDRYIVVYDPSVADVDGKTDKVERSRGFKAQKRYGHALKGFAATLSGAQVAGLRADPEVAFVSPDRPVRASASAPLAANDTAPAGIRRIEAAIGTTTRLASAANVAVIDTGIDLDHRDLNAVHGTNCVGPGPAEDDNGHGTHVAGTVAALNNGVGVTGVAPGTRLYAAKALDGTGSGTFSQIICAVEWATRTRVDSDPANDIAVATMSLTGSGPPVGSCSTTTDALHRAICNSTATGVTYVVAAGNEGWDFDYAASPDLPAAYPEVLAVTAMADSDGRPGTTGPAPACGQGDDTYATFSNYASTAAGRAHLVAAPGSCVRSTSLNGSYATASGTSMAAPHVAGVVALCLDQGGASGPCSGLAPAQVIARVRSEAAARTGTGTAYGFSGDPVRPVAGRSYGHLVWAGTFDSPPSTTVVTATPNPSVPGQAVTLTATVASGGPATGAPTGSVAFRDGATALGTVPVGGGGRATLTISALTAGTHAVTAGYLGGNFASSTSAPISLVVQAVAAPPTNVTATGGDGQLSVTWGAVPGPIDYYVVWAFDAAGYTGHHAIVCATCTSATVTGLANGRPYAAGVAASREAAMGTVAWSGWVTVAARPAAPGAVRISSLSGQLTATWQAPANAAAAAVDAYAVLVYDANGYTGKHVIVCATCTTGTVTGLTNGVWNYAIVFPHNALGWGDVGVSDWMAVGAPTAPQNVRATPGNGRVSVSWSPPASASGSAVTGYIVVAYDANGSTGRYTTCAASCRSAVVTGLTNGVPYTMVAHASNVHGWGVAAFSPLVTPVA